MKDINIEWNDIPLHPDHRSDLIKSGLIPQSGKSAGIYTVPPGQINKILGRNLPIKSLLAFPYPNCNSFTRYKLFPPYKQKDGHTMKYYQVKGSIPHLYVPPVFNPNNEIIRIVEGEKKALKGAQENLNVIGLGGIWNFAVKVEGDKPRLLEDFQKVTWKDT